jgi:Ca2+-binding RTX toxin-like protein
MLESLERRRLLSAVLERGVLNVGGTNGDDYIALRLVEGLSTPELPGPADYIEVNVNGERALFLKADVARVVVNANAGDDRVVLGKDPQSATADVVYYEAPTLVLGGRGQDTIFGGSGNDTLDGGTGVNELNGRLGDDLFRAGNRDTDVFRGGAGTDTIDYTGRTEDLTITLDDVADDGAQPGDFSIGLNPPPFIPELDDVGADIENVIGGLGDDEITGNASNNILSGGGGDDMLFGGYGRDILNGNWGNDRLIGGRSADVLIGGGGNDTADYSDHADGVYVTLDGIANDGAFETGLVVLPVPGPSPFRSLENDNVMPDIENVIGTDADDRLTGNDASNTLDGRGGNDTLDGGRGNDLLRGGDGNDLFYADDGDVDTIRGGAGDDSAQAHQEDVLIGAYDGVVTIVVS